MRIVRILRGIGMTALVWAVAWVPISLISWSLATRFGTYQPLGITLAQYLFSQAIVGAINGSVFASVLAVAGRRKTFATLGMPWIAACGAVGAALFPFVARTLVSSSFDIPYMALLSTLATNAALGAGCATLTLSIARRAPSLPSGDDAAQAAIDAS